MTGKETHRLKLTDKIKAANSGLFVAAGIVIIMRTAGLSAGIHAWFPLLVGISFIAFGAYRIRYVVKYLRGGQ